ncbi:MAG: Activator of Hsp90 ATPase 1 family protein [Chitinophagaceae bacterium]|nr:Activator of Hsp90 ATPase 1 family protein [Chitinophagaceae bacterium]
MKSSLLMNFTVDKANKKINVEREFAAPLENVWAAWTQSELLDQWWAPRPWMAVTKTMDFKVGGHWLYAMTSPEGEKHWCKINYKSIAPLKNYSALDAFCDENGKPNQPPFPNSLWNNTFSEKGKDTTLVSIEITYESLENLENIINMGFQGGFTMGLSNLDELLAK